VAALGAAAEEQHAAADQAADQAVGRADRAAAAVEPQRMQQSATARQIQ
jgi:hypothetical protein